MDDSNSSSTYYSCKVSDMYHPQTYIAFFLSNAEGSFRQYSVCCILRFTNMERQMSSMGDSLCVNSLCNIHFQSLFKKPFITANCDKLHASFSYSICVYRFFTESEYHIIKPINSTQIPLQIYYDFSLGKEVYSNDFFFLPCSISCREPIVANSQANIRLSLVRQYPSNSTTFSFFTLEILDIYKLHY